jgi:thioesterase domain-containing protein
MNQEPYDSEALRRLQDVLYAEIPISRALGLRVVSGDGGLALCAPLAPNINHKDTAFAGSLNAVLTLAGWGLLWLLVDRARIPAKVVIQDSQIAYLYPVTADFTAVCDQPPAALEERFLATLRRHGRARLELHAAISEQGRAVVRFSGRYVVQRRAAEEA